MQGVLRFALAGLGGVAAIWWWRRQLPICDVCGIAIAEDAERCPKCGADFTDLNREYHSLS